MFFKRGSRSKNRRTTCSKTSG